MYVYVYIYIYIYMYNLLIDLFFLLSFMEYVMQRHMGVS